MIYKIYTFQYEANKFLYGLGKGHQHYITGVNYGNEKNKLSLYKKSNSTPFICPLSRKKQPYIFKNFNLLKLIGIVKHNNMIFTYNTINKNISRISNGYIIFKDSNHQHQIVNSLNLTYSIPAGSLGLPTYRANSGKSSIMHLCQYLELHSKGLANEIHCTV